LLRNIYRKIVPKPARKILWRVKQGIIGFIKETIVFPIMDRIKLSKIKGIYTDQKRFMADMSKYYNSNESLPDNYPKTVIYMADNRKHIGGLSDRLRAIVSVFKLCRELNIAFKINFISPFDLTDFLLPNLYDWNILPKEICYNSELSIPVYVFTFPDRLHDIEAQEFWARNFFDENCKQIHIYTNMFIAEEEYGVLFYELFKPTPELENLISYNLEQLGGHGEFISVAFRFLQLLGDFEEPYYPSLNLYHPTLPDDKKEILVNKCIEHLKEIYNENDCKTILVTSDSISFLEEAKKLSFVYVIPGGIRHIDACRDTDRDANLKLFLDYFVISCSKKVYLVIDEQMFLSGFSYRAALLNNVPFIIKRY
jgi:hypothetical protein